jgi:hypothetical protein
MGMRRNNTSYFLRGLEPLMLRRNLSLADVCRACGWSLTYKKRINDLKHLKAKVDLVNLHRICNGLGVDFQTLVNLPTISVLLNDLVSEINNYNKNMELTRNWPHGEDDHVEEGL